ncbi:MAG: hypothetical protein IT514_15540 [Burkholderiales bacterium]|nr:hypothetical protein [Burkholderiales bacterium]
MSAISVLNSFAQSREHDAVLIRDGISYGDVREVVRELSAMRGALDALLEIAEQVVDTRRCSVGVLRAMNEARRHVTPNDQGNRPLPAQGE